MGEIAIIYHKIKIMKYFKCQPTVKINIFKYNFNIIESDYVDFNMTDLKLGGNIMYFHIKKDNLVLWINTAIHLETSKGEYATEFMNKTLSVCKMLNNRRYQPVLSVLYDGLYEKYPTLPKRCPIKKVCK